MTPSLLALNERGLHRPVPERSVDNDGTGCVCVCVCAGLYVEIRYQGGRRSLRVPSSWVRAVPGQ